MRLFPVLAFLALAAPLAAQDPQRRQALEAQIAERFVSNYRLQAGLTDEQFGRFRTVALRSFTQRRERQRHELELWRALETQMRPGVAADPDSVTRLLDALTASRQAQVDQAKADDREYASFLSPVQRAQLYLSLERLQRSVEDVVRQRRRQGGMEGGQRRQP